MKRIFFLILILTLLISSQAFACPPSYVTDPNTPPAGDYTIDGDLIMTDTDTNQVRLPMKNDATNPTICFDGGNDTCNTGFMEIADNTMGVINNGTLQFRYSGSVFRGENADAGAIRNEAATSTNPTFTPEKDDGDTGIGHGGENIPVIIGGGVPLMVFGTTVTLTAAQINALETTPIQVVAAQGANTIIEFVSAMIVFDYTADFTVTNADNKFVIQYDATQDVSEVIDMNTFLEGSADAIRWMLPAATSDTDLLASVNKKLEIFNEGTGDVTGGTDSTVDVRITYRVYATGL